MEDISQAIRKALFVCNTGYMSPSFDSFTQNLVTIEDEDTIDVREIFTSDSSDGEGPWTPTYRTHRASPTPPLPREVPTKLRVVTEEFEEDDIYPP